MHMCQSTESAMTKTLEAETWDDASPVNIPGE